MSDIKSVHRITLPLSNCKDKDILVVGNGVWWMGRLCTVESIDKANDEMGVCYYE